MTRSTTTLLTVDLRLERDVVLARQRTRQIAELLGFDKQDWTRLATAVSEIARNAFEYAGGGRAEFSVRRLSGNEQLYVIRIADSGPGIGDVDAILDGRYRSATGLGLGLAGAKRLTDLFEVESSKNSGTTVTIGKRLPPRTPVVDAAVTNRIASILASLAVEPPFDELQYQNRELLRALAEARERQIEVARLNRELEETNRGVMALYSELDEKTAHLERLNTAKTRFLSELSHELRTPLNAIRNLSRYLLNDFEGPLNDGQQKSIGMLDRSAASLIELVDDWLDLAKIEAGRISVSVTPFNADTLFATLRGMFRPIAAPLGVELVFEGVGDLTIVSDEPKVSQVLRNFISNALKFTEKGEVRVRVRAVAGHAEFTVTDTGIGIAPHNLERIFEEFTQVEHSLQTRVKGTGLGLPLSRKLARLLGGDVSVESQPGVGSAFMLHIPLRPAESEEAPAERRAAESQVTSDA